MHPDRRRRGRAIRKQRRLDRSRPNRIHLTALRFTAFADAAAIAAAGVLAFGQTFAKLARIEAMHHRLEMIRRTFAPTPITLRSSLNMTTVTITAPSTAPWPLRDQLVAFAHDLHSEGIDVAVDLIRTCTICGCTDELACLGGCAWVNEDDDLCTTCDSPANRAVIQQRIAELDASKTFATALGRAITAEQNGAEA